MFKCANEPQQEDSNRQDAAGSEGECHRRVWHHGSLCALEGRGGSQQF